MQNKPDLLLLTTGGNITTIETDYGLVTGYKPEELLEKVSEVKEFCYIEGEVLVGIDSVNMEYKYCVKITEKMNEKYNQQMALYYPMIQIIWHILLQPLHICYKTIKYG